MDKADTIRALHLVGFGSAHFNAVWPDGCLDLLQPVKNQSDGQPNSILLSGVLGAGKTSLLACFAQELFKGFIAAANGCPAYMLPDLFASRVRYCTHTELSKSWEHEFDDNWTGIDAEEYGKAPVLFLDDLGTAPDNQSGRNIARMEALIDRRWSNKMKTFVASNISLADLQSKKNNQWNRIGRRLGEPDWCVYRELKEKYGKAKREHLV